jgi:kinesin family protein 1
VADRRSDEELVTEERHDVLAWIQVKELTPAGTYEPAPALIERPMDNGVFALRQGVQRRIRITLTHASGRQLEWSRIAGISMGHVRLVDQRGHMNDPTRTRDHIPLNVIQSTHWVEYKDDGTSVLQIEASWDSSLHDSIFLNRVTGAGQRALLRMAWVVDSSKCSDVLRFSTDMAVRICERQSRSVAGKSIIGIFGGGSSSHGKMLEKISVLYQVVLTPPITRRLAELWRANTASTYVRGEEFLGGWRPRGVQLVKEYHACAETIRKVEDVEDIRQCLALRDLVGRPVNPTQHAIESAPQPIMERVIGLWLKYQTTIEEDMVLNEEPPTFEPEIRLVMENGELRSATPLPNSEPHKPVKMNPEVMLVPKTDTVAKKGYLNFPISHDRWEKRWFVIRRFVLFSTLNMCRPYMFMYSANSETHELGVINLTLVRVDHKRDLEHMLQRNNVFAIYTKNNAYMLQAAAQDDMIDWIKHIDPWYYMLKQP